MKHALGILGVICVLIGLGSCVMGGGKGFGNALGDLIGIALFAVGVIAISFGSVLGELERIRDTLGHRGTTPPPPKSQDTVADRWNR